jgi:hypothetical protein
VNQRIRRAAGTLGALCVLAGAPAGAWRPETQEAIAREAAKYAPPDLARQIERHGRSYLAGVREPLSDSAAALHMKNSDGSGKLDATIRAEVEATVRAIQTHRPFAEIVRRFGRVSHFVADANLPLNAANADRDERRYFRDYLEYVESARPRFAVVFYGLGDEMRSARDLELWTSRSLARGRKLYPSIGEEYRRIAFARGTSAFDDRSTAFAVAALSYSHAVSEVIRGYRYIWLAAGGGDPRIRLAAEPDRMLLLRPGG